MCILSSWKKMKYCNHCTALKEALELNGRLTSELQQGKKDKKSYQDLCSFYDSNYIVLGASKINNQTAVTVLNSEGRDHEKIVELYFLPLDKGAKPICYMHLEYNIKGVPNTNAHIVDWCSSIENSGYGSVLMTHLINYLKNSGFHSMTGIISWVDFDHEEKLRHFYSKFGFEITDCGCNRSLFLKLQ